MHRNIFFGITAWLLGAATATAGCLLAVSLLGSGITTGGSGQLLTQDEANRELASEAAKGALGVAPAPAASAELGPMLAPVTTSPVRSSASPPLATAPGSATAGAAGSGGTVAAGTATSGSAPASGFSAPSESAAPSGSPAPSASPAPSGSAPASESTSAGTVLASSAGDVVATCQAAGAYLISWSPLQGYEVGSVSRGPAAAARVTFESEANAVTMTVSCSAGVPSATVSTGEGDDE